MDLLQLLMILVFNTYKRTAVLNIKRIIIGNPQETKIKLMIVINKSFYLLLYLFIVGSSETTRDAVILIYFYNLKI